MTSLYSQVSDILESAFERRLHRDMERHQKLVQASGLEFLDRHQLKKRYGASSLKDLSPSERAEHMDYMLDTFLKVLDQKSPS